MLDFTPVHDLESVQPNNSVENSRRSRYALGDAMMLAYGYFSNGLLAPLVDDAELVKRTSHMCHENSRMTIAFLADKHSEIFDKMFILSTKEGPFTDVNWRSHSCFAVKDKTGKWFVGSPSNWRPEMERSKSDDGDSSDEVKFNPDNNSLTTFFEGDTLDEAVGKMSKVVGGNWGDLSKISEMPYVEPVLKHWQDLGVPASLDKVSQYIYSGGEYLFDPDRARGGSYI